MYWGSNRQTQASTNDTFELQTNFKFTFTKPYLRRLRHSLVQGGGATLDLLLDGRVAFLSVAVALPHRGPLLVTQSGQLGADLQQLVDVGLVLRYGLPQELEEGRREGERKERQNECRIRKEGDG